VSHIYDEHETLGVLRYVVQQKGPQHVYQRHQEVGYVCLYYDRAAGCPSCLVGHVLEQLGFPPPPASIEGRAVRTIIDGVALTDFEAYWTEKFTSRAIHLLAVAQDSQDGGETWGEALERAERRYRAWHPVGSA